VEGLGVDNDAVHIENNGTNHTGGNGIIRAGKGIGWRVVALSSAKE
jgi:hypothetical protein